MALERTNNDGPYSPENCVWASRATQSGNTRKSRRFEYRGKTQSIAGWSRESGVPYDTLKARLTRLGYTMEQALTKPVVCGKPLPGKGSAKGRFDEDTVRRIRSHSRSNHDLRILADALGASYEAIKYIYTGKTYKQHVDKHQTH